MRVLFITARPPWPGRRGDQVRTGGLARELAGRHEVHVLAQRWPGFAVPAPSQIPPGIALETVSITAPRLALALAGSVARPVQVALHRHRAFRNAVRRRLAELSPDVAVLVLSRIGDVQPDLQPVPVVVDLVDALELTMARRAARQPWLRLLWTWEGRRMARWDRRLIRRGQLATVVAERDRRAVADEDEALADKVRVVPMGLRLDPREPLAVARHPVVVLTGNLGYFPTVDGIRWFSRHVWPRILRYEPRAEWWLAGARPARAVQRVAMGPGVRLFADPDDLRSIVHQAAVAVAPLWSGSGTPIKILEAMAASVPVVTTPTGMAGLDNLPAGTILAADGPAAFAQAVLRLLSEPRLAGRQAVNARRWLVARHDLGTVGERFERVLEEAIERFQ